MSHCEFKESSLITSLTREKEDHHGSKEKAHESDNEKRSRQGWKFEAQQRDTQGFVWQRKEANQGRGFGFNSCP